MGNFYFYGGHNTFIGLVTIKNGNEPSGKRAFGVIESTLIGIKREGGVANLSEGTTDNLYPNMLGY